MTRIIPSIGSDNVKKILSAESEPVSWRDWALKYLTFHIHEGWVH
jgi:hypothetical protein